MEKEKRHSGDSLVKPAPLLTGSDDDDGRPYTVPGDPLAPVKEEKPPPPRPAVAKSWDMVWSLRTRLKIFGVLLALNVVAAVLSGIIADSVPVSFVTVITTSLLQAFLIGTFDRIDLTRSAKGKVSLKRTWRIAFVPLKPQSLRWHEFESVSVGKSYDPKFEDWVIAVLLLFYGVVPGILWWWFVIRTDRVYVGLCKDHGFTDTILYRGSNAALAKEVAASVAEVAGLPYR
jgi:hypothetical protein